MDAPTEAEIRINVDGRTIVARPGPEDQGRLAKLFGETESITLQSSAADTEGHLLGNEVAVDVEGHAMTLRLPNGADAAAVRRMLAVGAVTASLVVAGALASSHGQTQSQAPAAGAPAAVQEAPMQAAEHFGLADSASQTAAEEFAESRAGTGSSVVSTPIRSTTSGSERNQDGGLADGASQAAADEYAANQRPTQPHPRIGGSHPE